jgi:gluconolactonase
MQLLLIVSAVLAVTAPAVAADSFSGPWNVEIIEDGFKGGEGPVWSRNGYLLFSDYEAERINKYVPGQKVTVYREHSNGANGNTLDRQGRLYTCEYISRRVTRTSPDGKIEVIADNWQGKRLNAPNDVIVRRDGNVYFTDPLFTKLEHRDLDFYGVYRIPPNGAMELVASLKTRPNGIALSPDGKLLYVANTDEKNVRAYDLDRAGKASNERILIAALPAGPDGMKVDAKGNLYITGRGIQIYGPDGKHLGSIELPGGSARNCAFGDKDFKTLYITGRTALMRVRMNVKGAIHY